MTHANDSTAFDAKTLNRAGMPFSLRAADGTASRQAVYGWLCELRQAALDAIAAAHN